MEMYAHNLLLDSLAPARRNEILSISKEIALPAKYVLQKQEERTPYTYFLTSGLASVVIELEEGLTSEAGQIGHEGVVGGGGLMSRSAAPTKCFMQSEGRGFQAPIDELRRIYLSSEEVRNRIFEYTQMQLMTTSQLSACNRLHETEPRLARWLLMVSDRLQENSFHLTHEFLAQMLGVHRPTLSSTVGILERAGLIRNGRGVISIPSRPALMDAACTCYPVTKRLLDDLYK